MAWFNINSGSAAAVPQENRFQQARTAFNQLGYSLAANNLTAARKAYVGWQSAQPNGGRNADDSIKQRSRALGQALQSGDLNAARAAYTSILDDAKSASDDRANDNGGQQDAAGQFGAGSNLVNITV